MRLLAFDCCFAACSAAVIDSGDGRRVLAARFELLAGGHAERLIPMLGEVMEASGTTFAALDAIAVTVGPGTFTGVRSGIAAARGLALATRLPVRGLPSLALIARSALAALPASGDADADGAGLAVAMDARHGQLFFQTFETGDARDAPPRRITPRTPPALIAPEVAATMLSSDRPTFAVGSGAPLLTAAAQAAGRPVRAGLISIQPVACEVELADLDALSPPLPLYLRPHDARPQPDKSLPRAPP